MNKKSKGVIIEVRDDLDMPIDKYGNRADLIMDPSSVPSRMNAGRIYEQYFNGMSRQAKKEVINTLGGVKDINDYSDNDINKGFDVVLEFLKIIDTEQYPVYQKLKAVGDKKVIIEEIINKELFLLYKVSSKKKPYQIVYEIEQTKFKPPKDRVTFKSYGEQKISEKPIMIAPLYIMLLAKTADNFLSSASAKTNHYGLPIGVGNSAKNRLPWRNSPVKILSETETRLYLAYGSRLLIAELKDRGNSMDTHEHVYKNVLNADVPTNIDVIVDRSIIPYGKDASLDLINNIFNAAGVSIDYIEDKNKMHPVLQQ